MKILTIVGARPQFVKAAALSRVLRQKAGITEVLVHTGQHYDENMSEVFFTEMEIPRPDYHLEVRSSLHGAMTGRMMEKIEEVILKEKPDTVLVYGDTNSTLAGALAAKKLHVRLAHVEAGLRSFNMKMPEEVNRILTDRISDLLFCPTDTAIQNLKKEGFDNFDCRTIKTGDVMQDAALYYARKAEEKSQVMHEKKLAGEDFILATIHRAENTDDPDNLKAIIGALNELSSTLRVIVPLHPRTRAAIQKQALQTDFEIIVPVGYFDMLMLLKNCALVITDSGGLQKEAFFFKKYCITIREQTEWVELVENGYNFIAGTDGPAVVSRAHQLMGLPFPTVKNLYGEGSAAENICVELMKQA